MAVTPDASGSLGGFTLDHLGNQLTHAEPLLSSHEDHGVLDLLLDEEVHPRWRFELSGAGHAIYTRFMLFLYTKCNMKQEGHCRRLKMVYSRCMKRSSSGRPPLTKTRVNLALGEKLVAASKAHADRAEMTLSELVAYLLRREISEPTAVLGNAHK